MRTGIEITEGEYIPYRRVLSVKQIVRGEDDYVVKLMNGDQIRFNNRKTFERLKNYVTMGHPVVDEIPPPRRNGVRGHEQ